MKIKFGVNLRKVKTGAEIYIFIFQISALLPALYMFLISGYPYLMTRSGVHLFLFDVGISALPRWETLLLSMLYRGTSSETATYFAMLGFALLVGLVAANVLKGKPRTAIISRIVFAVLIFSDLIFRLLPIHCNQAMSPAMNVIGFVIRLACLALVALDLIAHRRKPAEN